MTTAQVTQHEVAVAYSSWLEMKDGLLMPSREVDWQAVNIGIIERFGFGGLKRIKKQAWALAGRREGFAV